MDVLNQSPTIFTAPTLRFAMEQSTRLGEQEKKTLLTAILATALLHEANDALAQTNFYRAELKANTKKQQQLIEKIVDKDYGALMGDKLAAITFNNMDGLAGFINALHFDRFVKHSPSLLAGFGALMEQFHNAPELVLHRNGIKILEL